jgi:predicted RNase H-like HicB family nuclease
MHKYEIIIYWSEDDRAFVAEVPELPGCAAHGHRPDEALSNCQDAISLWLDTAREFGRPVPEPKGRRLQYA